MGEVMGAPLAPLVDASPPHPPSGGARDNLARPTCAGSPRRVRSRVSDVRAMHVWHRLAEVHHTSLHRRSRSRRCFAPSTKWCAHTHQAPTRWPGERSARTAHGTRRPPPRTQLTSISSCATRSRRTSLDATSPRLPRRRSPPLTWWTLETRRRRPSQVSAQTRSPQCPQRRQCRPQPRRPSSARLRHRHRRLRWHVAVPPPSPDTPSPTRQQRRGRIPADERFQRTLGNIRDSLRSRGAANQARGAGGSPANRREAIADDEEGWISGAKPPDPTHRLHSKSLIYNNSTEKMLKPVS